MALAFIFDGVGAGEWLVLLAVLLVAVGPRNLPSVARTLARNWAKLRRAGDRFMRDLMEAESSATNLPDEAFKIDGDEGKAIPLEVSNGH